MKHPPKDNRYTRRGVITAMLGAATAAGAQSTEPDDAAVIKALEVEAFAGLRAIFVSQKAFYAAKDRYTANFDEAGFVPDPWCEDGARLKIKEEETPFKKIGCHFIYELELLGKRGFRAHARGAVEPALGLAYLVEAEGKQAGIPARSPK